MSELCQAKDEQLKDMTQLHEATVNNLVADATTWTRAVKKSGDLDPAPLEQREGAGGTVGWMRVKRSWRPWHSSCQSQDKRLEDAAELRGMLEMVLRQKIKREESQQLAMEQIEEGFQRRMLDSQRALEEERADAASLRKKVLAQQESGRGRRKEKPRWAKMVFGNYQPNRWFTEEQIINKRPSSQTQMSSDQRGRGSDARRPGAQGMGRRDQGAAGHHRPRPREIEWAQHWRAEYNPYRTVKGAF
ncbi:hypothetical protein SKAU_G00236920 [Synaphobranchus kaupii]|uniref:Uncharacterized protein n=1 Tax=Synaphobranchus kaupii TaxID=118154 RepID=A0A9Q1F6S8_SYNKA|nr:hypothetical protein SKAU_G00236920 [Synaphobranchus kaupii]